MREIDELSEYETMKKAMQLQTMSEEHFFNKHPSIPKEVIKKIKFMNEQLIEGVWRGIGLDAVDDLFLSKQRVKEVIDNMISKLDFKYDYHNANESAATLQELEQELKL